MNLESVAHKMGLVADQSDFTLVGKVKNHVVLDVTGATLLFATMGILNMKETAHFDELHSKLLKRFVMCFPSDMRECVSQKTHDGVDEIDYDMFEQNICDIIDLIWKEKVPDIGSITLTIDTQNSNICSNMTGDGDVCNERSYTNLYESAYQCDHYVTFVINYNDYEDDDEDIIFTDDEPVTTVGPNGLEEVARRNVMEWIMRTFNASK